MVVKMAATTICGTDLHILKGDVPEGSRRTLGTRARGIIEFGAGAAPAAIA